MPWFSDRENIVIDQHAQVEGLELEVERLKRANLVLQEQVDIQDALITEMTTEIKLLRARLESIRQQKTY